MSAAWRSPADRNTASWPGLPFSTCPPAVSRSLSWDFCRGPTDPHCSTRSAATGHPELLLAEKDAEERTELIDQIRATLDGICLTPRPDFHFEAAARTTLTEHFRTTGLAGTAKTPRPALDAAGALLRYITETQKTDLSRIERISP